MLTTKRFVIVYILLLLGILYMHVHAETVIPLNKPFAQFPIEHQGWRMINEYEFSSRVMSILKPTDIMNRTYVRDDDRHIDLHVGFYDGGKETGGIHSPKHCLPGSGWFLRSSEHVTMEIGSDTVHMVQAVYQHGEASELFLYWFQVRDRSLNNEYALRLAEITGALFHGRRDTAFIRISSRFDGDSQQAIKRSQDFATDFYPVIREFLPS